uniref:Uncharacterized protein n=1 Tax=Arundo donax TaxID=35708 RepID=A0A0A9CEQ9_ARUDO
MKVETACLNPTILSSYGRAQDCQAGMLTLKGHARHEWIKLDTNKQEID